MMKMKLMKLVFMVMMVVPNSFAANHDQRITAILEQVNNSSMDFAIIQNYVLSMLLDTEQDDTIEALIKRVLSSGTKQEVTEILKTHLKLSQPNTQGHQVDKKNLETAFRMVVDGACDDEDDLSGFKAMLQTILDDVPLNQLKVNQALTKQAALDNIAKEYSFSRIELPKKRLSVLQEDLKDGVNDAVLGKRAREENIDQPAQKRQKVEEVASVANDNRPVILLNNQKKLLYELLFDLRKSKLGQEKAFNDKKEFLQNIMNAIDKNAPCIQKFDIPKRWDLIEQVVHHYKLPRIYKGG